MTISFNCPTCGADNSAREESGGEYTACNRCAMRLQIPRPRPVPQYAGPETERVVRVRYSYVRIVATLAVVIAVVTFLITYPKSHNPIAKLDLPTEAEENARIVRGANRVREVPEERAAPVVTEPRVVKDIYSTTKKPVGMENSDVKRTMAQIAEAQTAETAEKSKAPATNSTLAGAAIKVDPATEKPAEQKIAKKLKKKTTTKKRRSAEDWKSSLERAKALLDKQQWEAARKILVEASEDAPANEAAEARNLMRKLPPQFQPKPAKN